MKTASIVYHRATSLEDAIGRVQLGLGTAKFMAGGQSLMPMMNLRLAMVDDIIDISDIDDLRGCRRENGSLFIGAATTHAAIEDGTAGSATRGYLEHVAAGIAYRAVRNKGTIGGSLVHADPAADWPSALLALNAVAVIQGAAGTRQVPLAAFQLGLMETCLGEAELLLGVMTPELSPQARWSYIKFTRKQGEFAHSIGAVVIDAPLGIANIIVGAAASKPVRLQRLSDRVLRGMSADEVGTSDVDRAIESDLSEATSHDLDSYAFHLHKTIVKRALVEALAK